MSTMFTEKFGPDVVDIVFKFLEDDDVPQAYCVNKEFRDALRTRQQAIKEEKMEWRLGIRQGTLQHII